MLTVSTTSVPDARHVSGLGSDVMLTLYSSKLATSVRLLVAVNE